MTTTVVKRGEEVLRVAYIEDDATAACQLLASWRAEGYVNPIDVYPTATAYFERKSGPAPPRYGILLVDLGLPDMRGDEVIHRVKSDPALAHKAVVIITGSDERTAKMIAKATGADAWAEKPVRAPGITTIIRQLVQRDEEHPSPRLGLKIVELTLETSETVPDAAV